VNFGPLFLGAQIFDCGYLQHFSTDRHKNLHGWGFCGVASPKNPHPGSILSVDSNQNVESKMKNVESNIEKCVVQNSICILQEIRYFEP